MTSIAARTEGVHPVQGLCLAPGTLVYTTRRAKFIGARMLDGSIISIASPEHGVTAPIFANRITEFYGIAYDSTRGGFWLADKANDVVWFLELAKAGSANNYIAGISAYKDPVLSAPCILDYDSRYGLLAGCFGHSPLRGAVCHFDGVHWRSITPDSFNDWVTHCCWLPGGGYAYVTRSDSVLWIAAGLDAPAQAVTGLPSRKLCEPSGKARHLSVQHVQGLYYSPRYKTLRLADAALGCIFEIDLASLEYRIVAGKPSIVDSTFVPNIKSGSDNVWLGWVRGMAEDASGRLLWLEGKTAELFACSGRQIEPLGRALPAERSDELPGIGMISIPVESS